MYTGDKQALSRVAKSCGSLKGKWFCPEFTLFGRHEVLLCNGKPICSHLDIEGCFQTKKNRSCRSFLCRLTYTSAYMDMIALIFVAMLFFGDFVSVCCAVGFFTPLVFVLPAMALTKTRTMTDNLGLQCAMKMLRSAVAIFLVIGALACIGVKTCKLFHDM